VTPAKLVRWAVRAVLCAVAAAVLSYPADWAVWHMRGAPMGSVLVDRYTVATLKGGKEEWYVDGTANVDCSASLFQEAGSGACWWVRRHAEIVTRY
jgi:hypothetical protein